MSNLFEQIWGNWGIFIFCLFPIIISTLSYIFTYGWETGVKWLSSNGFPILISIFLLILYVEAPSKEDQELIAKWIVRTSYILIFLLLIHTFRAKFLLGNFFNNTKRPSYMILVSILICFLALNVIPFETNQDYIPKGLIDISFSSILISGVSSYLLNFQIREKGISNFFSIYKLSDIKKIEWADKARIEKIRITKLDSEKQIILNVPKDMVNVIDDYIKKHFPST